MLFSPEDEKVLASINPIVFLGEQPDYDLIKVYLSGEGVEVHGSLNDGELALIMLDRARRLGLEGFDWSEAECLTLARWPRALPVFDVGYLRSLAKFRPSLRGSTLALAGDYLRGPYIEGAARSGLEAANSIIGCVTS